MENKLWARELFLEYKRMTHSEVATYNHLRMTFPTSSFPKHANRLKKAAVLAVFWANMATVLSGGKVNYMAEWRAGRL